MKFDIDYQASQVFYWIITETKVFLNQGIPHKISSFGNAVSTIVVHRSTQETPYGNI